MPGVGRLVAGRGGRSDRPAGRPRPARGMVREAQSGPARRRAWQPGAAKGQGWGLSADRPAGQRRRVGRVAASAIGPGRGRPRDQRRRGVYRRSRLASTSHRPLRFAASGSRPAGRLLGRPRRAGPPVDRVPPAQRKDAAGGGHRRRSGHDACGRRRIAAASRRLCLGRAVAPKTDRRGRLPQRRSGGARRGRDRHRGIRRSVRTVGAGRATVHAVGQLRPPAPGPGDARDGRHASRQPDLPGNGPWPAAARGVRGGRCASADFPAAGEIGDSGIGRLRLAHLRRGSALGRAFDPKDARRPGPTRRQCGLGTAPVDVCQAVGGG